MKSRRTIIAALKCRLAELCKPPVTSRNALLIVELKAWLDWIRK